MVTIILLEANDLFSLTCVQDINNFYQLKTAGEFSLMIII